MPEPQAIVATITGADLLERLDRLGRDIDGIGRKIDALPQKVDDHETRLRTVERRMWLASGGAAFGGVMFGWLLQILGHFA